MEDPNVQLTQFFNKIEFGSEVVICFSRISRLSGSYPPQLNRMGATGGEEYLHRMCPCDRSEVSAA
jgi:hypothetical protein